MAIFQNRPMALAAALLIGATVLSFLLPLSVGIWVALGLLAATVTVAVLCCFRHRGAKRLLILLLLIATLLGAARVLAERYLCEGVAEQYQGTVVEVECTVKEIYSNSVYGSRMLVELHSVNGKQGFMNAVLVWEGNTPLYYGDRVRGSFLCDDLNAYNYYEGQENEYRGDGAYFSLVPQEQQELTLVSSGSGSFSATAADLRGLLHQRMLSLSDSDGMELISAMLLGTRDSLELGIRRDFRRVGTSHLLAISGLHLSMIALLLDRFLTLLRVPKRGRLLLLSVLCVGYLLLTGCSFSLLRAVLMLMILQVAYFLKRDYDAFTALMTGGAVMLLLTPTALFDLSFQMTMLATAGILSFGELQAKLARIWPERQGARGFLLRQLRNTVSVLLITLCSGIAILPIQWLTFGEISLLSPLSNLLLVPLCQPLLALGLLLLFFSGIPVVGTLIAFPATRLAELALQLSAWMAEGDVMLSLRYAFVPFILIPMLALTLLLLILPLKKRRFLALAPACAAILAVIVCLVIVRVQEKDRIQVAYRTTGSQDAILMTQSDHSVICDFSGGSRTQWTSDYKQLQAMCATDVDILMLTHYHERQIRALAHFSKTVKIRQLYCPVPQNEQDTDILERLCLVAAEEGVAVQVYAHEQPISVYNGGTLTLSTPLYQKRSVEPALLLRISYKESSVCYQSGAYSEYAQELPDSAADHLILGGHGPIPHKEILTAASVTPSEVILSSEKIAANYTYPFDTVYRTPDDTVFFVLE